MKNNEFLQKYLTDTVLAEPLKLTNERGNLFECFKIAFFDSLMGDLDELFKDLDSPIEERLLISLLISGLENVGEVRLRSIHTSTSIGSGPEYISIYAQRDIENYRVDFYIEYEDLFYSSIYKQIKSSLIVECDGHEFHEKTKEQAKKDKRRDRILQTLGHPVFRFTGSEIFNSPFICSNSIIDFLIKSLQLKIDLIKMDKPK